MENKLNAAAANRIFLIPVFLYAVIDNANKISENITIPISSPSPIPKCSISRNNFERVIYFSSSLDMDKNISASLLLHLFQIFGW